MIEDIENRAKEIWATQSDGYNQWHSLGGDEKAELFLRAKAEFSNEGKLRVPFYHEDKDLCTLPTLNICKQGSEIWL